MATTVLETLASMNSVSGVTRRPAAMFAIPHACEPDDLPSADDGRTESGEPPGGHQLADPAVEVGRHRAARPQPRCEHDRRPDGSADQHVASKHAR